MIKKLFPFFIIVFFTLSCLPKTVSVSKVIDGDTIVLFTGEKIRYIGINAPEMGMPFYSEAKKENEDLVLGKNVSIEYDREKRDQHGRVLAYVFVGRIFVNYELLRKGLVFLYRDENNRKHRKLLLEAEEEARENRRNLWKSFHKYSIRVERVKYNAEGKDEENLNGEYVVLKNTSNERVEISGFSIKDESRNLFVFPEGSYIEGSGTVVVYTGNGLNLYGKFFWNHKTPIWNNDHDTAYLMDTEGSIVDFYRY